MPAGQIIGRVSVKVLPDTDSFRKEAKAKLAVIEKGLKFVVPTTLDITGAKRDLLIVLRDLNAENKVMNSRKIRLYVEISTDGMRGQLAKYRREATAMAKTNPVKIKADLVSAHATLELDKDSLKHVKDQLEHWRRGVDPLKVAVKLEYGSISAMAVSARLAILSRDRFVTIIPRVSKTALAKAGTLLSALSGARMLKSTWDNIYDMFKNLDKVIPLIAAIGNGIGLLAASLLSTSSNAFALLSSLASIGYLGLAMPGILGAFAVGLGITATAFMTFADNVPDVRKALTDLKKSIGRDFWKEAADPIREMANELLPKLGESAKVMGKYFGGLFGALADTFKMTLTPIFRDFNESVKIATDGTGGLAGVITKLGVLGAGYLPRLATWFVRITDQFNAFLAKADTDGSLKRWVDSGIVALHDLGGVLKGTFDVLADLGRAAKAAGGSTLGILADSLAALHKVTSGPVFQEGMADAFRAAHEMFTIIAEKSGPAVSKFFTTLSATLTTLLPIIGETLGTAFDALASAMSQPEFQMGMIAMFDGIRKGIEGLAPVMPTLGVALGKLGEIIGTMATSFGPLLASLLQVILDVFLKLEPAITPLIPILGDALLKIIEALAPALVDLAEALAPVILALGTALADAVTAFAPYLADIADALGTTLADALIALTPYLGPLVQAFTDLLIQVTPLIPQILALVVDLTPLIALFLDLSIRVLPFVTQEFGYAIQVVGWVVTAFQVLLLAVSVVIGGILSAAATVAEGLHLPFASGLRQASDSFKVMATKANSDMLGLAPIAGVAGSLTGASLAAGLRASVPAVNAAGVSVAFGVTFPLSNINTYPIGVSIVEGLAAGIRATAHKASAAANKMGQDTAAAIAAAVDAHSPSRVTMEIGRNIGEGLIIGMDSMQAAIRKSVSRLGSVITGMTIQPPSVDLAGVNIQGASGALSAAYGAAGAPLSAGGGTSITVPMMPTNSTPEDVADALLFAVRRMANGGVYAQA